MTAFPINFTAKKPNTERLQIVLKQSASPSPFTGHQQTVTAFAQWHVVWTWAQMYLPNAEITQGWLDSLQGQIGSLLYAPKQSVISSLPGRTLASPAFLYSTLATVGGWPAGGFSGLRVGQYLQIGTQLLRITSAPQTADASGNCLIEFSPFLRSNFPAGAAVNFTNPRGLFRLAMSDTPTFTLSPGRIAEFPAIEAIEAL